MENTKFKFIKEIVKMRKSNSLKSQLRMLLVSFLVCLYIAGCSVPELKKLQQKNNNEYIVAAYVWPSCHDEPISREKLWGEGIGEWEMIQKGDKRFDGHYQPRIPLWGYQMDDDPKAWEIKIDAAISHGVNTFIFDWYWYEGKPFLEEAINEGFLGASNNENANFYLMWANHDVPGNMWNHYRYKTDSLLWEGEVDWVNFKVIVDRVINLYFKKPNYLKIDNEPVFSIYSLTDLLNSFGGLEGTKKALDYFSQQVKKAGFKGLHIQAVGREWGENPSLMDRDYKLGFNINKIVDTLNIKSVTMYNMASRSNYYVQDYIQYGQVAQEIREKWDSSLDMPFFAQVSIGWDDTPRRPLKGKESICHYHNTPRSFGALLQKAKEYADNHPDQKKMIIINSWNEWVEGSYLEPDMKWGYGYLEEVKKVMNGKYEK